MPRHWQTAPDNTRLLQLWPLQSLPPTGFVWFIGATAVLITFPLLAVLATPVFWGLLPFVAGALLAIWFALRRSRADREILEELRLTPDSIQLTRIGPRATRAAWQANPYWVEVTVYPQGGPVPDYLTLRGNGREVELGAFLTPPERIELAAELRQALAEAR